MYNDSDMRERSFPPGRYGVEDMLLHMEANMEASVELTARLAARRDQLLALAADRGPFEDEGNHDKRQLLHYLDYLTVATLLLVMSQIFIYWSDPAPRSVLTICALVLLMAVIVGGRELTLRGRTQRGAVTVSAGLILAGIACALLDPSAVATVILVTLLAVELTMPFVSSRGLLWMCIASEFAIGCVGSFGILEDVSQHLDTSVGGVDKLVVLLVASGMSLWWLLWFHRRLSTLVADLKSAREDLEGQVAERTRRLTEELTRARTLEAELRKARELAVIASEEERRLLRRELHDELSPALSGCILTLERLRGMTPSAAWEVREPIDRVYTHLNVLRTEVRQLSYRLIPEFLDLGLTRAIRQIVEQFRSQHPDTAIEIMLPESLPELPAAVERAAYHIVQNSLRNVGQYAQAADCVITLSLEMMHETRGHGNARLHIVISDNGIGLPPGYRPGVGITAMRERAETLGGSLLISSTQPKGTRIEVQIPLAIPDGLAQSEPLAGVPQ